MKIVTYAEAKASGAKRYFTGRPCKNGHISERLMDGVCYACKLEQTKAWQRRNRDKVNAAARLWKMRNPERNKELRDFHRKKHRAKIVAGNKRWNEENRDKAAVYRKVYKAKKRGQLQPQPCIKCGATQRVHAHHEDHNKPFEVMWLCQPCHNRLHVSRKLCGARAA